MISIVDLRIRLNSRFAGYENLPKRSVSSPMSAFTTSPRTSNIVTIPTIVLEDSVRECEQSLRTLLELLERATFVFNLRAFWSIDGLVSRSIDGGMKSYGYQQLQFRFISIRTVEF